MASSASRPEVRLALLPQAEQPRHLSAADRERIVALAADLPGLWHSPTTTGGDRRAVVRQLIERVELTRDGESERIDVVIGWRGGAVTRHEIRQGTHCFFSALSRSIFADVIAIQAHGTSH